VSHQGEVVAREVEVPAQRAELRATVRYSSDGTGPCKTITAWRGSFWEAAVQDISQTGIGLLLSRRFEPGTIVAVELPRAELGLPYFLLARVVRVEARGSRRWLAGCALVNPLSKNELRALLEQK
jgi:hypothetical protein